MVADDYVRADRNKTVIDVLANDSDGDSNRLKVSEINGVRVDRNDKVWIPADRRHPLQL